MALKYLLPVIALTAAATVSAEEYQIFTGLNVDHVRVADNSQNIWRLEGQYFFDKKQTLGPLDQFEYINKVTNVGAGFARSSGENSWIVGGEYFTDNKFVVSARHTRNGDFDATAVGIGYLISDDFLVKAEAIKPEEGNTDYLFTAKYNHRLVGNDYIGFSAYTDDDFDVYGISSKYFASLDEGRYIAVGVSIDRRFNDTFWDAQADYYFSSMTSVGVSYGKNDFYSLNAKHYFNPNWALQVAYSGNADNSELKSYSVGVIGQF